MMEKNESLAALRKEIDLMDHDILRLLNQRMEFVLRLKRLKPGVTDHDRELEVFRHIRQCSQNLIQSTFSEKLFREIVAESKRLQEMELKVVEFQGEHGAYSETAALSYDGSFIPIPCGDFAEVFEGIKNDQLDLGIVPVENSLEGAIAPVNDLLIDTDLCIVGEITIPIHHCLLASRESDYREIKVVYSHPQALAQCRAFIARNKLEARPFYDTAGAAKMIARGDLQSAAAIAGALCADLYNLEIIKEDIEDHESNSTRFVVLSNKPSGKPGDKCSLAFRTPHKAGALFKILKVFSDAGVNLTRIESRPIRGAKGEYAFLLDFQGDAESDRVRALLESIRKETVALKLLGCYAEMKMA